MSLRRLSLRVDRADVEAASALLGVACGTAVVAEERLGRASAQTHRILVSAYVPAASALGAERALARAVKVARGEGLLQSAVRMAATVRSARWSTSWKRHYRPFRLAAELYVTPPWQTDFRPPRGGLVLCIDPGMAFGTGQHATTKMAVQFLLPFVQKAKPMLDVGCGSGILGIAAAQRGARVFACDVDRLAIAATRGNFLRNGLRAAAVRRADGIPLAFPSAPLIAANITADVLAVLAAAFEKKLEAGGTLVTSGVTERGRREFLRALRGAGLRMVEQRRSGEWLAFVHRKVA